MKFQAHRGIRTEAPENTMAALIAAKEQGFHSAEIDIAVTCDGQFVLLGDETLNRTARLPDGSLPADSIKINEITYEQALSYDFGVGFSRKFKGEKIPFLWDVLEYASKSGIKLRISNKFELLSDDEKASLYSLLKGYVGVAELTCKSISELEAASTALPHSRFHYDGKVNSETLSKLSKILPKELLTVWISISDHRLCKSVKKQAALGIKLITEDAELITAIGLGADIIETNGKLKPIKNLGVVADMHTHTNHSQDCKIKLEDMRSAQEAKGTPLVAVTDHCNIGTYKEDDAFNKIEASVSEVSKLNAKNDSPCRLLSGVEIGDGTTFIDKLRHAEGLCDYDVIIGSVHCTVKDGALAAYSRRDFSLESDEEIQNFMRQYFESLKRLVEIADFDILAHLTCPLRYVVSKHKRSVDMTEFEGIIDEILKMIIAKGIALEVNTSSVSLVLGDFVPDTEILKKYKAMGGYLITIGSDAHIPEEASANFDRALKHLKSLGFNNIFYYKNRTAYQCRIK